MEFGGVGSPARWPLAGMGMAATGSRPSLSIQISVLRGFGMPTEAVMPARAMAMLEGEFLVLGAICSDSCLEGCFSRSRQGSKLAHFRGRDKGES